MSSRCLGIGYRDQFCISPIRLLLSVSAKMAESHSTPRFEGLGDMLVILWVLWPMVTHVVGPMQVLAQVVAGSLFSSGSSKCLGKVYG